MRRRHGIDPVGVAPCLPVVTGLLLWLLGG
jgi:hypothetical protein